MLSKNVNSAIADAATENSQIGIWPAGTATGENAYSLAGVLMEVFEKSGVWRSLKVFVPDLGQASINSACDGIYAESIAAELPPALFEKYFAR